MNALPLGFLCSLEIQTHTDSSDAILITLMNIHIYIYIQHKRIVYGAHDHIVVVSYCSTGVKHFKLNYKNAKLKCIF